MEFEWKEGFIDGKHIDATECGNRILSLWESKQSLNKIDILEDAQKEDSPFRALIFRDEDTVAAQKYRLHLAGDLMRAINVVSYTSDGKKVSVRLVEKLTILMKTTGSNKLVPCQTFVPINIIMTSPSLLDQLLTNIDGTIEEYRTKRSRLKEYAAEKPIIMEKLQERDNRVMAILSS